MSEVFNIESTLFGGKGHKNHSEHILEQRPEKIILVGVFGLIAR